MAAKKNKKVSVDESAGFGLNLGALLQAKGVPSTDKPEPEPVSTQGETESAGEVNTPVDFSACGRLVLRHERKGRGGKTVTVIRGFTLPEAQLRDVARQLRRSLGCGAGVEQADRIVLQGDQLERARLWLEQQGAMQVVLGTRPQRK